MKCLHNVQHSINIIKVSNEFIYNKPRNVLLVGTHIMLLN